MTNSEIYSKIDSNNRKINQYDDCIYYLNKALKKCSSIGTGLNQIKTTQYNKVCEDCNDAIGYQEPLISSLKLYHNDISDVNDDMYTNINSAITSVNNEVNRLLKENSSLYSQLI